MKKKSICIIGLGYVGLPLFFELKKETFIKIVLPLIVAENGKILDDTIKLKKITYRKYTSDEEKQWIRQTL